MKQDILQHLQEVTPVLTLGRLSFLTSLESLVWAKYHSRSRKWDEGKKNAHTWQHRQDRQKVVNTSLFEQQLAMPSHSEPTNFPKSPRITETFSHRDPPANFNNQISLEFHLSEQRLARLFVSELLWPFEPGHMRNRHLCGTLQSSWCFRIATLWAWEPLRLTSEPEPNRYVTSSQAEGGVKKKDRTSETNDSLDLSQNHALAERICFCAQGSDERMLKLGDEEKTREFARCAVHRQKWNMQNWGAAVAVEENVKVVELVEVLEPVEV